MYFEELKRLLDTASYIDKERKNHIEMKRLIEEKLGMMIVKKY